MYVSKYYTCEEIDQRLLQGYYDDFVRAGFAGTINEFWAFVLSIADKVDKKDGYGLSKNDFTDKLKEKLDGIEEKANYITKLSQLENDMKYQTEAEVKQMISDLVDGADDALDTLKELAEALGNDPNFATTITNKLTDLRTRLTEEINRAKEAEASLGAAVAAVQDNLEYAINAINGKIDTTKADLKAEIDRVEKRVDKNAQDIKNLDDKVNEKNDQLEDKLEGLIQTERDERIAADNEIKKSVNELQTLHINDKASLEAKIAEEASNRVNADTVLDSKINEEITNRQSDTSSLQGKIDQERVDRHSEDQVLHNEITKEVTDRTNADNALQLNIDKEAQARTSADQVLQTNINSEATSRIAKDLVLEHKIDDLQTKGESDKTEVLDALSRETNARIAGDAALEAKKVDKREGYSLTKNDLTDLLKAKLDGIEEKANYITKLSQLVNDPGYQTEAEVEASIQKIIGSAPEVLDTLKEIADALGNDPNFATTITKKLASITEQVNQETEDRIAADAVLQTNINTEVQARKDADVALEVKVKEYVDNKSNTSDTAIGVLRRDLTKEVTDRTNADTTLQSNIDKESTDRKAADTAHNTALGALTQRISDLALDIQGAINTVKNELTVKVDANTASINENTRDIERNTSAIAGLTKTVGDNYTELKDKLNEEIVDRTAGDSILSSKVDTTNIGLNTETSERKSADQVLQVNLEKEVVDRTAAVLALKTELTSKINSTDQTLINEVDKLNTKITQEKADRTAADTALGTRINSLESGSLDSFAELEGKVNTNTQAINTEKDRAIAKENSLKADIDTNLQNHKDDMIGVSRNLQTEKTDRLAADVTLQNNIDKEVTDRKNADNLINNSIAQEISDRKAADQNLENDKVDKVDGKGLSSNDFTDILFAKLSGIQANANYITKVSQLLNDSGFQNQVQVEEAIQKIIGSAPEVLDTLAEIAKALGDDPNFAATITAKLTELTNNLAAEKNLRELGDNQLQQSFTNLSNNLTTAVDTIRTYVSETRTELLTSLNATNALVTQNTANIQRNLELIQGIQNTINTSYTAIKDLLETEIAARKAEDIRLEAKINQNITDLDTEREERIAADKVLQDNIDIEEAARIAADKALGLRVDKEITDRTTADTTLDTKINKEISDRKAADVVIDTKVNKEITDRTNADTALDNKYKGITDGHDKRLIAEEAVSISLPDKIYAGDMYVNSYPNVVVCQLNTHSKDSETNTYLSYPDGFQEFAIMGATSNLAGILTSDDKNKLDGLDPNSYVGLRILQSSDRVYFNFDVDNGLLENDYDSHHISIATHSEVGVMSTADKIKLDGLDPNSILAISTVGSDASKVVLTLTKDNGVAGNTTQTLDLPAATTSAAGVMSAEDKINLDMRLPDALVMEITLRERADTALATKFSNAVSALETKHNTFANTKGEANGLASLDANGLVPAVQLPSYVDDIIDVYAKYDKSPTGVLSNIKLYSDAANTSLVVGEGGKIYLNIKAGEPGYTFRWSGTVWAHIDSGGLIIGNIAGTAYDGAKGELNKESIATLNNIQGSMGIEFITPTTSIERLVDSVNIKVGKVYRSDTAESFRKETMVGFITLPAATTSAAGVMTAADKVKLDTTLPNNIATAVNNLKVELKKYIDDKSSGLTTDITALQTSLNNHIANKSNPHAVTKSQVGLSNVDNTSDANKPVSTAQATSIADAKAAGTSAKTNLDSHISNKSNPHVVTRAQLGLATTDSVVFNKTTSPAGLWKETSDERLKSGIQEMNHTLDQICQIPTKRFILNGKVDEGTIAQGLEEAGFGSYVEEVPINIHQLSNIEDFETIILDGEEYAMVKQVEYHKMSVLAIEGIKLLRDEISNLRSELQELKNK